MNPKHPSNQDSWQPFSSTNLQTPRKPSLCSWDYGLVSSSSAQPIQGAVRFLSATSGLCSGRHSYVLLLAPSKKIRTNSIGYKCKKVRNCLRRWGWRLTAPMPLSPNPLTVALFNFTPIFQLHTRRRHCLYSLHRHWA